MTNFPSGTVTFLFTDIEGSTKLAQEHRDTWEALRARHHAILRADIAANNGNVFQIIGDAFCAAFHTAGDAVRAAVKSQVDLHAENWVDAPIKVRMGIHTGEAKLQTNGDYHGYLSMSRVQRLMSAAHGGQVLISLAAEQLVRDELPEGITLRDMGERRLKDLIRREHIYQLVIPNLPVDFPPIKTLDAYRHNLPVQLTSLIGREKEVAEIKKALTPSPLPAGEGLGVREYRLITLTGAGGTGKTRLSIRVAEELLDTYKDGVWFIELAPLSDPALVTNTIAKTIGMSEEPGRSLIVTLTDWLRDKEILFVLDNCEHLIEACADFANTVLRSSTKTRILATSREAFGIAGEFAWRVPSLPTPDPKLFIHGAGGEQFDIDKLEQYAAVQLFIERACFANNAFLANNKNMNHVAQICYRLDGIPLAIELAAARVKVLQVEQIAERLDDRFRLLTGGVRTALPHHQTLRSTIDWSYDLLTESEKLLLRRLAVFAGGWTLEAAEAVCSGEGIESADVLDLLTRLTDKSLVMVDDQAETSRYRMLETIRQYALEKLIESRQDKIAHDQHLDFFLQLAENAENQLIGPDQVQWLNRLEREHDNFRTALEWSIRAGRGEEALRMAGALGIFWWKHTHYSEGRRWFRKVLEDQRSSSDQAQVRAWRWAGFLAFFQNDAVESRRIYSENLEREQALGDSWGIAFSLHMLANIVYLEGDIQRVRELHEKSIALSRKIEATWVLAMAQFSLGYAEQTQGNLVLAEKLYRESLDHFRRLGEKWGIGTALENLGNLMCSKGDLVAAKKFFLESLELSRELGDKDGMIMDLSGLASVFQSEGKHIICARLQGVVVAKEREYGNSLQPVEQELFDTTAAALKESMGAQAYQKEFKIGMTLTLEEAVSLVAGGK